ncbi:Copper transport protein 86 [Vanrija pseudolonga]|uniref:Ataxin-10 homolog n=1 Tax=Vanrija pseudolonga TaxID=143232 RepID=A0AAF0Y8F4_9TREE|nr:Copper transport protein 86 [Vanrija pseudolonga]
MDASSLVHALAQEGTVAHDEVCLASAGQLERAARFVAVHLGDRPEIFEELEQAQGAGADADDVWALLGRLWAQLADSFDPTPGSAAARAQLASEDSRIALALAAAKLERNLVAGVYEYQKAAHPHEPAVRRVIFNVTTFTRIEDPKFFTLHAVLAQLLSNLVSPTSDPRSEDLADTTLETYLSGGRDDDVVIRLLDSRDIKTNTATIHLINNLTRDERRIPLLLRPAGVKWLAQLLGRMDEWLEAQDGLFELAAAIFSRVIDAGLQAQLYAALAVPDEAVTPSQTTLLKLVDSSLASASPSSPNPAPSPNAFILDAWHALARYAALSMNSGQDDARLPKILAALILATEALSAIVLRAQARADAAERKRRPVVAGGDEEMVAAMKSGEKSVVKPLVELLRATNTFLPRVKPTRPEDAPEATQAQLPFANIKRDLVRLLAALAYGDTAFGDAVREAGGVELVLSLCETDERNPYLREHALLAVRNLMTGNPANQAIIAQMDPLGVVGDNGELLPLPEKMKKGYQSTVAPGPDGAA